MFSWHRGKGKLLFGILSFLFHCTLWIGQDPTVAFEMPAAGHLIKHPGLFKMKIIKTVLEHLFFLFK